MKRILLYTDQPILAEGLKSTLPAERFDLMQPTDNLADLQTQMTTATPDIVLIDLTRLVNFEVLSAMRKSIASCPVVLWVGDIHSELAFQAMGLGVRGILRKALPTPVQIKCIEKVLSGEQWFEQTLINNFLTGRRVPLTKREGQVVALVTQGLKNKEIGGRLHITEGTVKVYLSRLFQKIGLKDRYELAIYGLRNLGELPAEASVCPRTMLLPPG